MTRRRQQNSISLFPFLAVLVCTMGALILLLLVTTRQIRTEQRAEAARRQKPVISVPPVVAVPLPEDHSEEELAAIDRDIAELRQRIDVIGRDITALDAGLRGNREALDQVRADIADKQRQLDEVLAASDREALATGLRQLTELNGTEAELRTRLDEVQRALLAKQQELVQAESVAEANRGQLQERRSALVALREQVLLQRQELRAVSGTATLLEFSNPTGTSLTPIVVNVSQDGFEFLPSGLKITASDLEGSPVRDNPLLVGVLEAFRYRSGSSVLGNPYVLLLVRPDGCLPFYTAQRILSENRIRYGYELLLPDAELTVGPPDAEETRLVRDAMLQSLERRATVYARLLPQPGPGDSADDGDGDSRRLVVRPDGRVEVAGDSPRRPLDGQFYAGGEAPPPGLLRDRPRGGWGNRRIEELAEAERIAAGLRAQASRPGRAAGGEDAQPPGSSARGAPENTPRDPVGQAVADRARLNSEQAAADFDQWMQQHDQSPLAQFSHTPPESADSTRENSVEPGSRGTTQLPSARAGQPASGRESLLSQLNSDGPRSNGTMADSHQVPSVLSQARSQPQADGAQAPGLVNEGQPNPGISLSGGEPADARSRPVDLTKLDPALLELMKGQRGSHRSDSRPVGITVFVDAEFVTVDQQPTIPLVKQSGEESFQQLLKNISDEVESGRNFPLEPVLPIVKLVVSPGAERNRYLLTRQLRMIGIPSASIVALEPYITAAAPAGHARVEMPPADRESQSEADGPLIRERVPVRGVSGSEEQR